MEAEKVSDDVECKVIVAPEAIKLAGEAIENFNKKTPDLVGAMTCHILEEMRDENIVITEEELCRRLFLTKTKPVYSEMGSGKYNDKDYCIMKYIAPLFTNVKTKHSGDVNCVEYFKHEKNITLVMPNGVLKKKERDEENFTEEEYKNELKRRLKPILLYLIDEHKDEQDIDIRTTVLGAGVWASIGTIDGKESSAEKINECYCQACGELLEEINNPRLKMTVHCSSKIVLKKEYKELKVVDHFNIIDEKDNDQKSHIVQVLPGDPLAMPGNDVFDSGKAGGTSEQLVMNTNIPEKVYGITVPQIQQPVGSKVHRELVADQCAKSYKLKHSDWYEKDFYKCKVSVVAQESKALSVEEQGVLKAGFKALSPNELASIFNYTYGGSYIYNESENLNKAINVYNDIHNKLEYNPARRFKQSEEIRDILLKELEKLDNKSNNSNYTGCIKDFISKYTELKKNNTGIEKYPELQKEVNNLFIDFIDGIKAADLKEEEIKIAIHDNEIKEHIEQSMKNIQVVKQNLQLQKEEKNKQVEVKKQTFQLQEEQSQQYLEVEQKQKGGEYIEKKQEIQNECPCCSIY